MSEIGKIYVSITPYYNKNSGAHSYKSRPVLIISEPKGNDQDYTVLPVSSISNKKYYNEEYDVEINSEKHPLIKLKQISYVRTHKQTTVNIHSIDFRKCIGDLKKNYPDCYDEIERKTRKNHSKMFTSV